MAAPDRIRVLIAEDSLADAELNLRELKRAGLAVEHRIVDTEPDFARELDEFAPDIIVSDFTMPKFDGMADFLTQHYDLGLLGILDKNSMQGNWSFQGHCSFDATAQKEGGKPDNSKLY